MPKKGVVPPHLRKYLFKKGGRRKGRKHSTKVKTMPRRRGGRRRGRGSRRQGVGSWITSVAALGIGLNPVWRELAYGVTNGDWDARFQNLNRYYNPLAGDRALLAQGYGSLVGGIVFKIAASELLKRARLKTLIPRIG